MFRPGYVKPHEGESISHYLGRWRRHEVNSLSSPGGLGRSAGIGSVTARWEKFRFYHFPTQEELEAVSKVMEMDVEELRETLPTQNQTMKLEPIVSVLPVIAKSPIIAWSGNFNLLRDAIATG